MNLREVEAGEYVAYKKRILLLKEDDSLSCEGCALKSECTNDCLGCFRIDGKTVIYIEQNI